MSHAATNWAIQQRGLPPAAKLVLWYLADRHNPDFGCFPSQEQLVEACEMSRSSVNRHLEALEAAGLVRRVPRIDPATKRQLTTRYLLAFEAGFRAPPGPSDSAADDPGSGPEGGLEPCPEMGHGPGTSGEQAPGPCVNLGHGSVSRSSGTRHPEIGPSRVPKSGGAVCHSCGTQTSKGTGKKKEEEEEGARARGTPAGEDAPDGAVPPGDGPPPAAPPDGARLLRSVLEAVGLDPDGWVSAWWRGAEAERHVLRWREVVGLAEAQILETARGTRRERPDPPDGPKALDRAMERAATAAAARAVAPRGGPGRRAPEARRQPPREEVLAFWAERINGPAFVAASSVSASLARDLVAAGLVAPERLRERGIAA